MTTLNGRAKHYRIIIVQVSLPGSARGMILHIISRATVLKAAQAGKL